MTPVASLPTRRLRQLRFDAVPGRRSPIDTAWALRRPPCSDAPRLTLEQSVANVWDDLLTADAADCLVCGAQMERHGSHGECASCGTKIS